MNLTGETCVRGKRCLTHFNNPVGTFGIAEFGMIPTAMAEFQVVQLGPNFGSDVAVEGSGSWPSYIKSANVARRLGRRLRNLVRIPPACVSVCDGDSSKRR